MNTCVDCGKEITGLARCRSCWLAYTQTKEFREYKSQEMVAVWDKKGRVEPNHCIDCGVEVCRHAVRCHSCAMIVRFQDPEERKKKSELFKRLWKDPEFRLNRHNKLVVAHARGDWGPETYEKSSKALKKFGSQPHVRERRSKRLKRAWADPNRREGWCESIKKAWTPERKEFQSEFAKQMWADGRCNSVIGSPTQPEKVIMGILDELDIEYEFNDFRLASYVYDFYLPAYNLLIEYDGWYWHKSDRAIARGTTERDVKKNKLAEQSGFNLIRLAGLPERDLTREEIMIQLLDHLGDRLWA